MNCEYVHTHKLRQVRVSVGCTELNTKATEEETLTRKQRPIEKQSTKLKTKKKSLNTPEHWMNTEKRCLPRAVQLDIEFIHTTFTKRMCFVSL